MKVSKYLKCCLNEIRQGIELASCRRCYINVPDIAVLRDWGSKDYIIEHNDYRCSYIGSPSYISIFNFGSCFKGKIYVSDKFYTFSKETQEFIIQHEVGHLKNNPTLNNIDDRNMYYEYMADLYAARIVGYKTAIDSLKEIKDVICTLTINKEMDKRVIALQIFHDKGEC